MAASALVIGLLLFMIASVRSDTFAKLRIIFKDYIECR